MATSFTLTFTERLRAARIAAVIRTTSAETATEVGRAVVRGGITALEVAFTTPQADLAIARLRHDLPTVLVGAGTVLDEGMLDAACAAGAEFLMSPHLDERLVALARDRGVPFLPGALTPTEIQRAWAAGAACVKVFPSSVFGPSYLAAVRAPLPHIPLLPTGGVSVDNLGEWLAAGALAVGVGGNLVRGTEAEIEETARRFVAARLRFETEEN